MEEQNIPQSQVSPHPLSNILLIVLVGLVMFGIGLGTGYLLFSNKAQSLPTQNTQQVMQSSPTQVPSPPPLPDDTHFYIEAVKIGDVVGSMKIEKLGGYKSDNASYDNAYVEFSGKETITGEVLYHKPASFGGEKVCMQNLDDASIAKMPKIRSVTVPNPPAGGRMFFCFTNLELAKKQLVTNTTKDTQGIATITLDKYKMQRFPVDSWDLADFISKVKYIC